eukprot:5893372-Pyramimonas_sp.AAC.1
MPFRWPPAPGPCPPAYPETPVSRGNLAGVRDLGEWGFWLSGMAAAGGPTAWRPSSQRQADIDSLGPTAARRAARKRRQAAVEAAIGRRAGA